MLVVHLFEAKLLSSESSDLLLAFSLAVLSCRHLELDNRLIEEASFDIVSTQLRRHHFLL